MTKGKLIGVGVGPGDPELLTMKAGRILSEVPVICAPRSAPEKPSIAEKGLDVAFVTLGDPSIFSTFSYLQKRILEKKYEVEMVPGITSFTGCASTAGIPLVEKDEILVIVPKVDHRLESILDNGDTFVIMKTSRHGDLLEKTITADKRNKEIISVQNCTMANEEVVQGFVKNKKYLSTTLVKFSRD